MKIVISESQYNNLVKSILLSENEEPIYIRQLNTVNLSTKRRFDDPNTQKAWDEFKQAEKKFTTMMNSHGSKYNYKFPCTEPSSGYNSQILNACTKTLYGEYNTKNRDLYNMSKYLEWARSFIPNWQSTYPEIYEYQIMTTPEGLGMMRNAYGSCKKGGNYDCSYFMDYYNKIGKNIDGNVYQLSPEELDLLKKQWSTLHDIAQAAKSRKPLKVIQSVVKAGVAGTFETVKQAIEWIKNNIDAFMEGLREYLNGTAGGIITSALELTGLGKLGVAFMYGVLVLYDLYKQNWIKFIHSTFGLLSTSIASKIYKPIKSLFSKPVQSFDDAITKITQQTWFKNTIGKFLNVMSTWIGSAKILIKKVSDWITKNLGLDWLSGLSNQFISFLEKLVSKFLGLLGKESPELISKQMVQKGLVQPTKVMLQQKVVDPTKEKTAQELGVGDEYKTYKDIKKASLDLKRGDIKSTIELTGG